MKITSDRIFYFLTGVFGGIAAGLLFLFAHIPQGVEQGFWSYWLTDAGSREYAFIVLLDFMSAGMVITYLIFGHKIEKHLEAKLQAAEEANHDMNEFISLMSHQMRTALTVVSWEVNILLQESTNEFSPKHKDILTTAYSNVKTCNLLIEDLLNFGKLGLGMLNISLHKVRLKELEEKLHETIKKFAPIAAEKNITFAYSLTLTKEDSILVDAFRMTEVVESLIENALHYIGSQGKISILVENDATNLTIKIADSGIGIPEAEQPKIFSKFFRASNAKVKQSDGTGIGLYLCRQFVRAHQGEISFVSTEGVGTTFTVKLPMRVRTEVESFFLQI